MKKIYRALLLAVALILLQTNILASPLSEVYIYEGEYTFDLGDYKKEDLITNRNLSHIVKITTYLDRGKRIYVMSSEDENDEQRKNAVEFFNKFMEEGAAQQNVEYVWLNDEEYYVNESVYSSASPYGSYAYSYTWAKYYAHGSLLFPHEHECWGGQSGTWNKSGTDANYIKLYQNAVVNVSNATSTIQVQWPAAYTFNYASSTQSSASWSSATVYNTTGVGAQHNTVEITKNDIQQGSISSFIYTDSADIKYNNIIYNPSSSVKFSVAAGIGN